MKQEEQKKLFQELMKQNLRYQLALESYTDDTNQEIRFLNATWKKLGILRRNKNIWSIEK